MDPGGGCPAAGREGCARDLEHRYGVGGGAPDQGPGKVVGEGNTTQHTPESRFVPSFLGKGPSASLEEGKVGRETPLQDK